MKKYHLAKLVQMASGLNSRKRIQKTLHLLQAAGCDFGLTFRIHHYGPYSVDVARLLDDATSSGILLEKQSESEVGTRYDYQVTDDAASRVAIFEQTEIGAAENVRLQRFKPLLKVLCDSPPRVLELASTIVAFQQAGNDWDGAVAETAKFKDVNESSRLMTDAERLATDVLGWANDKT